MGRFLINLFKHPGTWFLGVLILTLAGIGAAPMVATVLAVYAAVAMAVAMIILIPYLLKFNRDLHVERNYAFESKLATNLFAKAHPWQALAIGLAVVGLILALVLTIGFFTGGAGFAFMAPVFMGLASPFVALAAATGIPLATHVIAAFLFVIAPLVIFNNIKRFLSWLDTFTYDGLYAAYRAEQTNRAEQTKTDVDNVAITVGKYHGTDRQNRDHLLGSNSGLYKDALWRYGSLFADGVTEAAKHGSRYEENKERAEAERNISQQIQKVV